MNVKVLTPNVWPNFVRIDLPIAGVENQDPRIDVGHLDDDTIDEMCKDFRRHCLERRQKLKDDKHPGRTS